LRPISILPYFRTDGFSVLLRTGVPPVIVRYQTWPMKTSCALGRGRKCEKKQNGCYPKRLYSDGWHLLRCLDWMAISAQSNLWASYFCSMEIPIDTSRQFCLDSGGLRIVAVVHSEPPIQRWGKPRANLFLRNPQCRKQRNNQTSRGIAAVQRT